MARAHKDVEFHVEPENSRGKGDTHIYNTLHDAAAYAVNLGLARGENMLIDVVIWSQSGAYAYGGEEAEAEYLEDPDASVFERIVVRAESQGRVS